MAYYPSVPVLVVDDHDTEIRAVRNLLRQLGFVNVEDTNSVAEALTKMRVKRYGLVISNWRPEPTTGCEFLREVRGDAGLNRTPVIMIGELKSENVVAAKKAGASSYIVKPFNAQALKAKIEAAFAARTALLPERHQAVAASQSRPHNEAQASVAAPSSAVDRLNFEGLFTSTLK